jgi:hypothetical protein
VKTNSIQFNPIQFHLFGGVRSCKRLVPTNCD